MTKKIISIFSLALLLAGFLFLPWGFAQAQQNNIRIPGAAVGT